MSGNFNSGRRGRPPKPIALRAYEGNRSKTPLPLDPEYPVGIPACPSWMPALGREYWDHLAGELGGVPGLLRLADRGVLERVCHAYHRLWTFTAYCEEHGYSYKVPVPYAEGGEDETHFAWKPRPEARFAREAGAEFDRLRSELGLSPTARVRLALPREQRKESLLTG